MPVKLLLDQSRSTSFQFANIDVCIGRLFTLRVRVREFVKFCYLCLRVGQCFIVQSKDSLLKLINVDFEVSSISWRLIWSCNVILHLVFYEWLRRQLIRLIISVAKALSISRYLQWKFKTSAILEFIARRLRTEVDFFALLVKFFFVWCARNQLLVVLLVVQIVKVSEQAPVCAIKLECFAGSLMCNRAIYLQLFLKLLFFGAGWTLQVRYYIDIFVDFRILELCLALLLNYFLFLISEV